MKISSLRNSFLNLVQLICFALKKKNYNQVVVVVKMSFDFFLEMKKIYQMYNIASVVHKNPIIIHFLIFRDRGSDSRAQNATLDEIKKDFVCFCHSFSFSNKNGLVVIFFNKIIYKAIYRVYGNQADSELHTHLWNIINALNKSVDTGYGYTLSRITATATTMMIIIFC